MQIVAKAANPVVPGANEWQRILARSWRDPVEFCRQFQFDDSLATSALSAHRDFRFFCPQPFAQRIEPGNINDPLLKQVWPTAAETDPGIQTQQTSLDPLREQDFVTRPGLLQKYRGRALLITTGACAIHCRYCFRRSFPYEQSPKSLAQWQDSLTALAADPSISEVILSGGDPLILTNGILVGLLTALDSIGQIRRIRLHTRLPIMIPDRIDAELVTALEGLRSQVVIVIHSNHAQEFDPEVDAAIHRLGLAGCQLLNQSVLLRGVNDSVAVLQQLSERLLAAGVLPYYLHQMDPIRGANHFSVPIAEGRCLIEKLRSQVSGYLVPRYVVEQPGDSSKTILA